MSGIVDAVRADLQAAGWRNWGGRDLLRGPDDPEAVGPMVDLIDPPTGAYPVSVLLPGRGPSGVVRISDEVPPATAVAIVRAALGLPPAPTEWVVDPAREQWEFLGFTASGKPLISTLGSGTEEEARERLAAYLPESREHGERGLHIVRSEVRRRTVYVPQEEQKLGPRTRLDPPARFTWGVTKSGAMQHAFGRPSSDLQARTVQARALCSTAWSPVYPPFEDPELPKCKSCVRVSVSSAYLGDRLDEMNAAVRDNDVQPSSEETPTDG